MRFSPALRGQELVVAVVVLGSIFASAEAATPRTITRASMALTDTSLPQLRLTNYTVDAAISGRVARVSTESIYHNDSARDLEAIYTFPLPDGATVERFVMWMDGQPVEGKVAEKERARATYQRIVSKRVDPGLVEQVEENLFRFRIFPVRANGDQRIRIEYSQVLPVSSESNTMTFNYPLYNGAPHGDAQSAKNFVVSVALEMESPIAKLESPTHKISQRVLPDDPKRGTVSIEETQTSLDRDFALNIALKDRALPVTALAFRTAPVQGQPAEDGTLMLFITPQLPANEEPAPKDVVLVMDTSGSMEGPKIEQARKALHECLTRLRPKDRFALISFSDFSKCLSDTWSPVNADTLLQAKTFVNGLQAAGGTNIAEALERALAFPLETGRVKQILFATDGIPSVGVHQPAELCKIATSKNAAQQRIFTLGIGYDVNTALLDKLAAETHGERAYVRESDRIDQKVGALIDKISAPVLTDVTIEYSPTLGVEQVYPPKISDLYLGQQVVLAGRYKKAGSGQVILKGKRNGKDIVIEAPLNPPEASVQATAFLPKQWAMRKTGYLLDQMRLYGENAELKTEVVRLGTQFGIVTPYTSYLALEAGDRAQFDAQTASRDRRDVQVPPDITAKAELGDHFETTNLDRPDTHSAFGNPNSHQFHSDLGTDGFAGAGASNGATLEDMLGVGGARNAGSGGGWGGGNGTSVGADTGSGRGSFGSRSGGGRKLMVKRHGGSKATENGVDSALRWLAYHQEPTGNWDSQKYGSPERVDTAVTSLALLTFLGAGHSEKVGEFKDNVKRAIAWLKAHQRDDGRILDAGDSPQHAAEIGSPVALAALALAEATAMANVPETRVAAQNALDYCIKIRTEDGWGYEANSPPNLIATTWFIMALKSGKVAGLNVDHAAFDGGIKFLDSVEHKGQGADPGYAPPSMYWFAAKQQQESPRLTAMGCLCRQFLGWKKEDLEASVEGFVAAGGVPQWNKKADLAYMYFGTLCVFQQSGELWKKWNENIKSILLSNQRKDGDDAGSWDNVNPKYVLGRAGQTASAALCLEIYYRYAQLNPDSTPYNPPANVQPVPRAPMQDTGKDAVDYSEYIRRLKEGEGR